MSLCDGLLDENLSLEEYSKILHSSESLKDISSELYISSKDMKITRTMYDDEDGFYEEYDITELNFRKSLLLLTEYGNGRDLEPFMNNIIFFDYITHCGNRDAILARKSRETDLNSEIKECFSLGGIRVYNTDLAPETVSFLLRSSYFVIDQSELDYIDFLFRAVAYDRRLLFVLENLLSNPAVNLDQYVGKLGSVPMRRNTTEAGLLELMLNRYPHVLHCSKNLFFQNDFATTEAVLFSASQIKSFFLKNSVYGKIGYRFEVFQECFFQTYLLFKECKLLLPEIIAHVMCVMIN